MKHLPIFLFLFFYSFCMQGQNLYPSSVTSFDSKMDSAYIMKNIFKHSFISKEEFKEKEVDPYQHINILDSNVNVRHLENSFELLCTDRIVDFVDMPEDEYGYYSSFDYIGQLDTQQPYAPFLLHVDFSEYRTFILVDNKTGEDSFFYNQPVISPNGKYLIDFSSEPFSETECYLTLYKIGKDNLVSLVSLIYNSQWLPSSSGADYGYWGDDGMLYVPMINSQERWDEDGMEKTYYLKIKINLNRLRESEN